MWAVLSKPFFKCPREHFQGKIPSEKTRIFFLSISDFQLICFGLCIFFHFWTSTSFWQKFWGKNVKIVFKMCGGFFRGNGYFWKTQFIYFFRKLSKKLSAFYRKLFNVNVNIAFYLSREKPWGRIFFQSQLCFILFCFLPKIKLSLLSENFRRCRQSCTLSNHKNILSKHIFFWKKNIFFSSRGSSGGRLRNFSEIYWQFSVSFLLPCPKEKFEKKKHFFIAFGARSKSFRIVDRKRSAVLSKLLSTSLEENFEGLFFYTLTSQNHSGFWRKVFGRFQSYVSNFQRNISQVAFSMSRRIFWTKISLCIKQRIRSSSLSDFGQKKTL